MLALKSAARVEDEQIYTEKTDKSYYIVAYWHGSTICVRDVGHFGLTIHARYIFGVHSSTVKVSGGYSAAMFFMVSILGKAKVFFGHFELTIYARYFFSSAPSPSTKFLLFILVILG